MQNKNFQTVDDLRRFKCSLGVVCRNCGHQAFLSVRYLKARIGLYARFAELPFTCSLCRCVNVRLSAAPEQLAEKVLDPRMHFAGTYAKYTD